MSNIDKQKIQEAYEKILEMSYGVAGAGETQFKLTQKQLIEMLFELEQQSSGVKFMSITQIGQANSRKAPVPEITLPGLKVNKVSFAKVSQINIEVGSSYTDKVNRSLEKSGEVGNFVAQPSRYDSVEGVKYLRQKDGQYYIQYHPVSLRKGFQPIYVQANVENPISPADFKVVNTADISQYLRSAPESIVPTRIVSISSIAAIKINKRDYVITDLDPIRKNIWQASGAPMPIEDLPDT